MQAAVSNCPSERDFLIDHIAEGYIRIQNNHISQVNHSLVSMLGYQSEEDLPGLFPELIFSPNDFITYTKMFINQYDHSKFEISLKGGHGEKVIVRCNLLSNNQGNNTTYLLIEDITLKHQKLKELMTKSTVFEYNPYMVLITDHRGVVENVNKRFRDKTGFSEETMIGKNIFDYKALISPLCGLNHDETLRETIRKSEFVGEFSSKKSGNNIFLEEVHVASVYENGKLCNLLFIGNDITDKKELHARLENLAYHDQMTGFIRRDVFNEVATSLKDNTDKNHDKLGLLFLDLDKFKPINDKHGHYTGDRVIIECAERFKKVFRNSDVICRQGGDEFSVLCPQLKCMEDLEAIGKKIIDEITHHFFNIDGLNLHVGISVGGCLYSGETNSKTTLENLIKFSDHLMYEAKADPLHHCVFKNYQQGNKQMH